MHDEEPLGIINGGPCMTLIKVGPFAIAADWDYRNQNNNSMTPSQTRRAVDALGLPAGTPTGHMRSQVSVCGRLV